VKFGIGKSPLLFQTGLDEPSAPQYERLEACGNYSVATGLCCIALVLYIVVTPTTSTVHSRQPNKVPKAPKSPNKSLRSATASLAFTCFNSCIAFMASPQPTALTHEQRNQSAATHNRVETPPWFYVPSQPIISVEHPCIVKNVDKGIKSLGGEVKLSKVSSLHKNIHGLMLTGPIVLGTEGLHQNHRSFSAA